MNSRTKIAAVILAALSLSSFAKPGKISVVTTMFAQYDAVRAVAGTDAEISMLLKPGTESHSFEPTPRDIRKIQKASLFVYTGGENDEWVEKILGSMGKNAPKTARLLDMVETVEESGNRRKRGKRGNRAAENPGGENPRNRLQEIPHAAKRHLLQHRRLRGQDNRGRGNVHLPRVVSGRRLDWNGKFPKDDEWIRVAGRAFIQENGGFEDLFLKVESLEVKKERGLEFVRD